MPNLADQIREPGGPTSLDIKAIPDGAIPQRSGTSIVGTQPSALTVGVATYANGLRETSGPTTLPMGAVAEGDYLRVSSFTIVGQTPTALATAVRSNSEAITPAPDATYDWDSTAKNVAVTHAAAACDVSLPAEASVVNWPPEDPPRKLYKMNSSVNGINLLVAGNCTINGGAAGDDMSPIPDSDADPSNTTLAQWVYVYRQSATAYWVWGGA